MSQTVEAPPVDIQAPPDGDTSAHRPHESLTPADERRNFRLIVVNGIMTGGPSMLFDPNTIMAAFITQLTGSQTLVGLVSGVMMIGWVWPQLFVANWIEPKPTKLFVYRIGAVLRFTMLSLMCGLMWMYRHDMPPWFAYGFIGLFFLYWSAGGYSGVGWYEVLSKTIPAQRRPSVFAWRQTGADTGIMMIKDLGGASRASRAGQCLVTDDFEQGLPWHPRTWWGVDRF